MTAQIKIEQSWVDNRFHPSYFGNVDYCYIAPDEPIWTPDTYFLNEQEGSFHNVDQPNTFTKVYNTGRVHYSKRITMAISCPMHLVLYPHDNQTCRIDFTSYRYSDKDVLYRWKWLEYNASAVSELSIFRVTSISNQTLHAPGKTILSVNLQLQRLFSDFLLRLYIPSCMLVAVSCMSFWIDWRCAPARVPLAIVTLLAMTTQSQGINANLPPVSYTKAIDIWIGCCIGFIFAALLEYALVNYIGISEEKRRTNDQRRDNGIKRNPDGTLRLPPSAKMDENFAYVMQTKPQADTTNGYAEYHAGQLPDFTTGSSGSERFPGYGGTNGMWAYGQENGHTMTPPLPMAFQRQLYDFADDPNFATPTKTNELPYKHYGTNSFPPPIYPVNPACRRGKPSTVIIVASLRRRGLSAGPLRPLFRNPKNVLVTTVKDTPSTQTPPIDMLRELPPSYHYNADKPIYTKEQNNNIVDNYNINSFNNPNYNFNKASLLNPGQFGNPPPILSSRPRKGVFSPREFFASHYAKIRRYGRADLIDNMSRIMFPIGFCGFNIVYWTIYLPKSDLG